MGMCMDVGMGAWAFGLAGPTEGSATQDAEKATAEEAAAEQAPDPSAAPVEELLATDAAVVVVISYRTQPSYSWYHSFFAALRTLEGRGVAVY